MAFLIKGSGGTRRATGSITIDAQFAGVGDAVPFQGADGALDIDVAFAGVGSVVSPSVGAIDITAQFSGVGSSTGGVAPVTETWGENSDDDHRSVTTDTRLNSGAATTNYGTSTAFFVEWDTAGDNNAAPIRIDLSALPLDSDVDSARFRLTVKNANGTITQDQTVLAYACLRADWDRLQATATIYKTGSNWGALTARGANTDVTGNPATESGELSSVVVPNGTTQNTQFYLEGLGPHIQSLISGGSVDPLNIVLHAEFENGQHVAFASSRGTDGERPLLEITYSSVTGGGGGDPGGPGATGDFVVHADGKIYDPLGNLFTPQGCCIFTSQPGANADVYLPVMGDPGWRFNYVRLNYLTWPNFPGASDSDVDAAIEKYLAAGMVVEVEYHRVGGYADGNVSHPDGSPTQSERQRVLDFYERLVLKYGVTGSDDYSPYVWYSTIEEPGGGSSDSTDAGWVTAQVNRWLDLSTEVIDFIRGLGCDSVITVPSMKLSQDLRAGGGGFSWGIAFGLDMTERSAHVKYGIPSIYTGRDNLVPRVHAYGNYGTEGRYEALRDFVDHMEGEGLPVIFGEFGSRTADRLQSSDNLHILIRTDNRYCGFAFWHGDAGDVHNVTTSGASGRGSIHDINSLTAPTNLSSLGKIVWDITHPGAFPPGSFALVLT